MIKHSLTVILVGLLCGLAIISLTGRNPLPIMGIWLSAGFSCSGAGFRCAPITAAQYATPLIFSGLSAMIAFRAGLISIGQFGQMIVGAGVTAGLVIALAETLSPLSALILALAAGSLAGGIWGAIPGALKAYLNINEVIVTLIMNSLAPAAVGALSWQRIPEAVRLIPLVPSTKVTGALFIALITTVIVFVYLWWHQGGLELRMSGQAANFARYAGMRPRRTVVWAMLLSGIMAGLGGGLEVVGVHYRFVTNFSTIDMFDGIVVSLLGQLHPLGIVFSAFLLGGLRLGALNGLQLMTNTPREIGDAVIAVMMILITLPHIRRETGDQRPEKGDVY
ncbi:MAG: hypothetical protein QNJ45_21980 [Ardenticatenaceae bacterium]|nr:hypothetical protein [Ardenticatenaceae bacterium]